MSIRLRLVVLLLFLLSCKDQQKVYDASGMIEAIDTIISAEATGTITSLNLQEGQQLKSGQQIGAIDSTQLYLKKLQLEAQINAMVGKIPDMTVQLAAAKVRLDQAVHEQQRNQNLFKDGAITGKQMDDANALVALREKEWKAEESTLGITNTSTHKDARSLMLQVAQVNNDLKHCRLINLVNGRVQAKYVELHEMVMPGKALYKIADLSTVVLRVYISGDQLQQIKLDMPVQVITGTDDSQTNKTYTGNVGWISDKAEFTPKIVQTRNERANLVYAVKITLKNDGYLKIGMPADVIFNAKNG